MKEKDSDAFLDDIKAGLDAEREVDYTVTAQEAANLLKSYPSDTPEGYKKIKPEEFFDGA